ncbi:hypothetical protein ABBQ32_009676 [Trebouxia sp. C0010 RCD-2024]
MPANTSLADLTATQAIAMLCARDTTAVLYAQALLDRYDSGGYECLNAFISLNRSQVLAEAAAVDAKHDRGEPITPLCGLPLAVKDTIDVEGYRTTAATPGLKEAFPGFSAPLIDNYKAKNGIILGKMNLAELSSTVTSINTNSPACYSYNDIGCSTPLNAYNQTRISGGSSAGSAASVAARFAPWALCEDTGGSCRAPAIANGIYGLRPTLGCYNYSDALVLATFTRDTVGSFGRTMEDLILLDSVIRTPNTTTDELGGLPVPVSCDAPIDRSMNLTGLKLGLPSNFGWVNPGLSGEIQNITNHAMQLMMNAGVEFVPFDSQGLNDVSADAWGAGTESYAYEDTDTLARQDTHTLYLYRHNYTTSVPEVYYETNRPDLQALYTNQLIQRDFSRQGSTDTWVKYLTRERPDIISTWNNAFEEYDVSAFMYPGFSTTLPEIDACEPYVKYSNGSVVSFPLTNYFEIDAQAVVTAMAFPVGFDSTGAPFALQLAAPAGMDGFLLSLGLALEKLFGPLPPPPTTAACSGCSSNVVYTNVTYSGVGAPLDNDTWTNFGLTFSGTCESSFLSSYGSSGVLGSGNPLSASGPAVSTSG